MTDREFRLMLAEEFDPILQDLESYQALQAALILYGE